MNTDESNCRTIISKDIRPRLSAVNFALAFESGRACLKNQGDAERRMLPDQRRSNTGTIQWVV
jgi:hypothetical protein